MGKTAEKAFNLFFHNKLTLKQAKFYFCENVLKNNIKNSFKFYDYARKVEY